MVARDIARDGGPARPPGSLAELSAPQQGAGSLFRRHSHAPTYRVQTDFGNAHRRARAGAPSLGQPQATVRCPCRGKMSNLKAQSSLCVSLK